MMLTISSSTVFFSSCLQSFPASGSFQMSQLFASGGQSIGASASASVLSVNIHGWFPLGLTGLILLSKGLSRAFSSTTVRMHQPSLWYNSHIRTWLRKNHSFDCMDLCQQSDVYPMVKNSDSSQVSVWVRPWNHCDVIQVTFGVQTSHFVIQGEISEQKPYKLCSGIKCCLY